MTGKLFSTLSFQRWLGVESSTFDKAGIEISNDGGATWAPIWSNPAATLNESAWGLQTYDISAAADNRPDVRLRWYLGTTDGSVTFEGWNIDDVAVSAVSPPTAPAPCTGDADGDRDVDFSDITAVLGNFGLTPGAFGPGDADGNGTVEFADITTVLANFGIPCP
jgi:hypothetical protein